MTAVVLEMQAGDPYKDQQARVGLGKAPTIVLWPDTDDERALSIYRMDGEIPDPDLKCFFITTDDADADDDNELEDDEVLGIIHLPHCPLTMWSESELWRRRVGTGEEELPSKRDLCPSNTLPTTTVSQFRGLNSGSDGALIVTSLDGQHRHGWLE